jgi:hypothetical protein
LLSAQTLRSVLLFADFIRAAFNAEALRIFKGTAVFDKPYIKKSAWTGAEDIPKSREEALAWLVTD